MKETHSGEGSEVVSHSSLVSSLRLFVSSLVSSSLRFVSYFCLISSTHLFLSSSFCVILSPFRLFSSSHLFFSSLVSPRLFSSSPPSLWRLLQETPDDPAIHPRGDHYPNRLPRQTFCGRKGFFLCMNYPTKESARTSIYI